MNAPYTMPLTSPRLGFLVNALIVAAAVALAAVAGLRSLHPEPYRLDEPGVQAPRAMLDWKAQRRTLLVALGPDCADCRTHAPFLRRLVSEPREGVSVFAVAEPPAEQAAQMLSSLGIERAPRLLIFRFARVQLRELPALILVDGAGTVRRVWKGPLDEAAVLAAIQ
jgi:thiol-disulfide isomerase/thioredoxin